MSDKIPLRPKEDELQTFSVRAERTLISQLDQLSNETGYSRNQLIVQALKYFVENVEVTKK